MSAIRCRSTQSPRSSFPSFVSIHLFQRLAGLKRTQPLPRLKGSDFTNYEALTARVSK